MNKVRILPPEIASKIAAGEVVERPASVVKELLENALDAEADTITIELEQAGKTLIRIQDNGSGIAEDDMAKIFNRHATSKIASLEDLFDIHSLGFRGEALYSIAAVADIILKSKPPRQSSGWELHLRGGNKMDQRPSVMGPGTHIEVKELFFNTPARRKFLKSNTSEMNQILDIIVPYTLKLPAVRFLLQHQDRTLIDVKPTQNHKDRMAEILHLDAKHILENHEEIPDRDLKVTMFLGDINIIRSRRDMQFIFVNGRPVQNKSISYHMNNVFRLIMAPDQFPFFVVFIDLPAPLVDANIHPTKREVKIKDEQALCHFLRRMCEATLMTQGQTKEVRSPLILDNTPSQESLVDKALKGSHPFESQTDPDSFKQTESAGVHHAPTEQYSFPQADALMPSAHLLTPRQDASLASKLSKSRYIGSFVNKFLLFECDRSLLIIDQHAAQERITFEHFIIQMQKGRVEVQHLLSPYLIKVTSQEQLCWEEAKDRLDTIGFASTQFDAETLAVHTYPVLLKDPHKAFQDILAGGDVIRCDHETIARRACRASIMAGDPLDLKEAESLRQQLINCQDPFTCPHGRPTVIELKEDFLNKQFLRT